MVSSAPEEHFTSRTVVRALEHLLEHVSALDLGGRVADYIPELAKADPRSFAISAASVAGRTYAAGDTDAHFTIQSISKPFVYAIVLAELGVAEVKRHVGVEPSGQAFNAISFDERGRPANPMINAGAVVTTSLVTGRDANERFARIRDGLSAFAGRELELDESVYQSEASTGDRNRALASLAKSFGVLGSEVEDATDAYFRQCSLVVTSTDLAVMGATLANNGINPVTGQQVVTAEVARDALSLMASCGMYDQSGEWMFSVGMPAKSGVGGGIVAVKPGQYGIGVFSPPLDEAGNSSRGVEALSALSGQFGLHMFSHPNHPVSPVESMTADPETGAIIVRVGGIIDFVNAELLIQATSAALRSAFPTLDGSRPKNALIEVLTLDFTNVSTVTPVAARLIESLIIDASAAGYTITTIDPAQNLA